MNSKYHKLADAVLNQLALKRLGYTAKNFMEEDEPPCYHLLHPDGFLATDIQHKVYLDVADMIDGAHYDYDTIGCYIHQVGYATPEEAFAAGPSYVTDLNLAWQLGEGIYCSLYRLSDREEQSVTISADEQPHDETPFYSAYGSENPARLLVIAWLYYKDGEDEEWS